MSAASQDAIDDAYLERLRQEIPGLRVVDKADDGFSKLIDVALKIVTLGGQHRGAIGDFQDAPLRDGDELMLVAPVAGG